MSGVQVQTLGMLSDHEFYLMEITGFSPENKKLLEDNLNTIHAYSWLVNLDDSENPNGEHWLYVKGKPSEIAAVLEKLKEKTEDSDQPLYNPTFTLIDPDEVSKWRKDTVRKSFEIKESESTNG